MVSQDTFLGYTRDLVHKANRGGLILISDDMYIFFHAMELVVKPELNSNNIRYLASGNNNERLLQKISTCSEVIQKWGVVAEEDDKHVLLDSVMKCWIKLRMKSFTAAYMFLRRKDNRMKMMKTNRKALSACIIVWSSFP